MKLYKRLGIAIAVSFIAYSLTFNYVKEEAKPATSISLSTSKVFHNIVSIPGNITYHTTIHGDIDINKVSPVVKSLYHAKRGDIVHIDINSTGGRVDAAKLLLDAMATSKAIVHTQVDSFRVAHSAAAIILVKGDVIHIGKHAEIIFHTVSVTRFTLIEGSKPPAYYETDKIVGHNTKDPFEKMHLDWIVGVFDSPSFKYLLSTCDKEIMIVKKKDLVFTGEQLSKRLLSKEIPTKCPKVGGWYATYKVID